MNRYFVQITPEKFEKLSSDILNIIGHGSPTIFKGVILLVSLELDFNYKSHTSILFLCMMLNFVKC